MRVNTRYINSTRGTSSFSLNQHLFHSCTLKALNHLTCTAVCRHTHAPSRSLQSSSQKPLTAPRVSLKSAGTLAFQCQTPFVWNSLPLNIRLPSSLSSIKCIGMNEQLLVKLTKWNRSSEMYSSMRRKTRRQQYPRGFHKKSSSSARRYTTTKLMKKLK